VSAVADTVAVAVRAAVAADVPGIRAIYAHDVLHGLASFEEAPPSTDEMARRRDAVLAWGRPWLVAETGGRIVGYAYAGSYRSRLAYRHTVEDSVYVDRDAARRGAGRLLFAALLQRCKTFGWRQMVAVIGDSRNEASIALDQALGFETAGVLRSVGFRLGRRVDAVLMQRPLGPGDSRLP
jgi:phosphinothricin acetyltransferase